MSKLLFVKIFTKISNFNWPRLGGTARTDGTARTGPSRGQLKFEIFKIRNRVVRNGRSTPETDPKRSKNGPKPSETVRKQSETVRNRPKPFETVRNRLNSVLDESTFRINLLRISVKFNQNSQIYVLYTKIEDGFSGCQKLSKTN